MSAYTALGSVVLVYVYNVLHPWVILIYERNEVDLDRMFVYLLLELITELIRFLQFAFLCSFFE